MTEALIIFIGAGFGGVLRHGLNEVVTRLIGAGFPYGILAINVVGSTAMGLLVGYWAFRGEAPLIVRLLLTTGVLGGFTTFSAFGLETFYLLRRGELLVAGAYVLGSVVAGLLALWLGFSLAPHRG